jgi:hypothetical protein
MDILQTVRADLQDAPIKRQREVAAAIGLSFWTLRKIIDGRTKQPRYGAVEKIRAYYLSPRDFHGPPRAWDGEDRRRA